MSNSKLNKMKSRIKNVTEVTLNFSSNVTDNSNNENIFPQKLLVTNKQLSSLRKAFSNCSSVNIKLPKTQLSQIGQSGESLGRLAGTLLKVELPLMKNI